LIRGARWAGRIIGLVAAIYAVFAVVVSEIMEAVLEGIEPAVAGTTLAVLGGIALAGGIMSWWCEWVGGVLLVMVSIGLGVHIGIFAGHNHFLAWLMFGFPFLVAGSLLLVSWRLSRAD
jgi:carbon starvation protein CstA